MRVRLEYCGNADTAMMLHYVKQQFPALLATTPKHDDMWHQLPAAERFYCAHARKMILLRGKRTLRNLW
jgi:hypothetical protein